MDIKTHITTMTFYHFRVEISYYSLENGKHGFSYGVYEGEQIVAASNIIYKTALEAGHGALDALEVLHGKKG